MHECNQHVSSGENDKISPVESYRNNASPNDHRDQGRDTGVQELEFPCVERWRPRQDHVGDSDDRRKMLETVRQCVEKIQK